MSPDNDFKLSAALLVLLAVAVLVGVRPALADDPTDQDPPTVERPVVTELPEARAEPAPPPIQELRPLGQPRDAVLARDADDTPPQEEGSRWAMLSTAGELARVGGALAIVLGLLLLARWMLRRAGGPLAGGGRPSGVLAVLARYPVARGQQLVLLKLGERVLLMHQGKGALRTLAEIRDPDEVAGLLGRVQSGARDGTAGRFHALLERWSSETPARNSTRAARRVDDAGNEVIDLTRRGARGPGAWAAFFGRRGSAA